MPAHKTASVREYVASTQDKLSLHVLPGHAPVLDPDKILWSHVKRTVVAHSLLRAGEKAGDPHRRAATPDAEEPPAHSVILPRSACRLSSGFLSKGKPTPAAENRLDQIRVRAAQSPDSGARNASSPKSLPRPQAVAEAAWQRGKSVQPLGRACDASGARPVGAVAIQGAVAFETHNTSPDG